MAPHRFLKSPRPAPRPAPTPKLFMIDTIEGEYHYVSFGPSYYTWSDWQTRPLNSPRDFGWFNSPQAARKEFERRHPVENNYFKWGSGAARLIKDGAPIMAIGNGMKYKK